MPVCRIFISLLMLAFIAILPGCANKGDSEAFVVGLEGSPTDLDPRFATDAYSTRIRPLLFDSLIEIAPNGDFEPSLATSWESENGQVYTFHLREGVHFHDGRPLTSKDVKYTFDYLKNPKNKCPAASSLEAISHVTAPDDATVVFHLKEVFVPILYKLVKGIVPAHLGNQEDFGRILIGSGPYRLERLDRGELIEVSANEDYYAGAPSIKKIRFEVVRNDTTRMLRLQNGDLHLVQNAIPPYAVKFFEQMKGIQVIRAPGINYSYIGFNLKDPRGITDKLEVRRAIAHAVDRKRIVKALLKGQATLADGLMAKTSFAHVEDLYTYEYDPEKAKQLLDDAGFPDPDGDGPKVRFTLSFKTSTNKLRNRIADVIAAQLEQVGIALEKRSFEWGTFFEDIKKGNFQTYTLSWVGVTDPDIFQYIYHSDSWPPAGANRGRYENRDVDRLIDRSRVETDPVVRKALLAEIQRIVAMDCVNVSLWWSDDIVVATQNLKGFKPLPGGEYTSLSQAAWQR